MPLLRLAYSTLYLIALIAVYVLWSQVGGQSHLDLVSWYFKLGLGAGVAFAFVRSAAAAVEGEKTWNGRTLRWVAVLLTLLLGCGLDSYNAHLYYEDDSGDEDDTGYTSLRAQPRIVDGYEATGVRGAGRVGLCPDVRRFGGSGRRG